MKRVLWAALLCGTFGCAAQAPVPVAQTPPPAANATPVPPRPAPPRGNTPRVVVDSLPSSDAIAVLGSIPEPLSTAQTIDPPVKTQTPVPVVPVPVPVPAPVAPAPTPARSDTGFSAPPVEAGSDTLRATTESVPVPAAVRPLGTPPSVAPVIPDSPAAGAPSAAAEPDTCWRLQVAAPAERAKAVTMQSAAKSLLLVPMVIVHEAGRYKVRSEECLPRAAADALRDRAVASGFNGVFLVREVRPRR